MPDCEREGTVWERGLSPFCVGRGRAGGLIE
jgi:hypothetical protein